MGDRVNMSGVALLAIVVSKDGSVPCARGLNGHPIAISHLIGAIRSWRFKPYVKGRQPQQFCGRLRVKFAFVNNRPSVEVMRAIG
jgi:hypothetical protein